jgi:MFS family permease
VMLIVGRALQGAAGAGVGQLVNVVISDMFSMRSVLVLTYFV